MSLDVLASSQLRPEKKMYSRLAVGRNDNYNPPPKKIQLSGGFIIASGKKGSVVWPSVGMVGGFHEFGYFGGFIITT